MEEKTKTLILIRHAKSSWAQLIQKDIERPLNERGNRDAPRMAEWLHSKMPNIDAFFCSTAIRAQETAAYFRKVYTNVSQFVLEPQLYMADIDAFYEVIESIPDDFNSVALFSHNFGISEFAYKLTGGGVSEMPTCAIAAITIKSNHWANCRKVKSSLLFFMKPKELPQTS